MKQCSLERDDAVITLAGVHDPMFQDDALPGVSQVGTQTEMAETISDLHLSPNTYTVLLSHRPESVRCLCCKQRGFGIDRTCTWRTNSLAVHRRVGGAGAGAVSQIRRGIV